MSRSRDAVIAVTATIFFGVFSRVTVRIPYMVWGYFDESFFISFVWWLLYAGSLYVAIREYMENVDSYFKVILQAGLFGGTAALIKTAADVLTEQIIINMNSGNAVISVFVMELELLIFDSGVMVFLYYFVAKKENFFMEKILTCVWGDHSRRSCGLYWNDLLLPSENRLGSGTVFRRSSAGWRRTGKAESDNKVCPGVHDRGNAGIYSVFYYAVDGTS